MFSELVKMLQGLCEWWGLFYTITKFIARAEGKHGKAVFLMLVACFDIWFWWSEKLWDEEL